MVCEQDNICIGTTNESELNKKTDFVLNRLRNAGMTIKEKKIYVILFQKKVYHKTKP